MMLETCSDSHSDDLQFTLFKQGNEKAFEFFFHKHYAAICGFCTQFLKDKDRAESIAQEAFIHLWTQREAVEKIAGIKSFLYTVARSRCLNVLKHESITRNFRDQSLARREQQLHTEVLQSLEFDPMTLQELEEVLEQFLGELPERTAEVFRLKKFLDKKNSEIAAELNISIKTVEAHMTKALSLLRLRLSDYLSLLLLFLFS